MPFEPEERLNGGGVGGLIHSARWMKESRTWWHGHDVWSGLSDAARGSRGKRAIQLGWLTRGLARREERLMGRLF
jgi:hypothetical protein